MKDNYFSIGHRGVGDGCPVFVIAEVGCNFEGHMDLAKEMIRKAAEAGADAVKFQTFVPQRLASKHAEKFWEIEGCPGETQLEEFMAMPQLSLDQYKELRTEAERSGLLFFSTPSDEESVDLLEVLNVPLYKIASMDITHIPLLGHVARTGKPIILSTGASNIGEIAEAVTVIREAGGGPVALLHCISNYPATISNTNLRMVGYLRKVFTDIPIGYSDHTVMEDSGPAILAAVALGATIIEKHFTFDLSRPGYDHAISADYGGLSRLIENIRKVEKALGEDVKRPVDAEAQARIHARRSIVASIDIAAGSTITRAMVQVKRPGTGIKPVFLDAVVGRRARVDIEADTVLQWDMI